MAPHMVVAPVAVCLVAATATLTATGRPRLQRSLSLAGGVAYVTAVAALASTVVVPFGTTETLVYRVGDWSAPFGIVLVADALSALLLALAAAVSLPALAFATVSVDEFGRRLSFHPLWHLAFAGVSGAFLTGDLFNLFVWFEVMLTATYVLVGFYGGAVHTRGALYYVVLNLLGSAVMLLGIGGLYAMTGTLNFADMARRLADPVAYGVAVPPTVGLFALLLAVFALKIGLVPVHFWVPEAYRVAPAPVSALLAGVVKKVGVYAVIRLSFTVFAAAPVSIAAPGLSGSSPLGYVGPVLFVLATASVFLGGLSALAQEDLERLLAYSSVGQIGFVVVPIAVAATVPAVRQLGIAAALVYAVDHGLAKGALFLAVGTLRDVVGSVQFGDLGGVAGRAPLLAAGVLVPALALIGIPPLAGFFGKLLVFETTVRALGADGAGAGLALVVVLLGSLLTLAYYTRAWNEVFWGAPSKTVARRIPGQWNSSLPDGAAADGGQAPSRGALVTEVTAVVVLAAMLVGFGVGAEALVAVARAAAEAAVDTGSYVDAVAPAEVRS